MVGILGLDFFSVRRIIPMLVYIKPKENTYENQTFMLYALNLYREVSHLYFNNILWLIKILTSKALYSPQNIWVFTLKIS